mgnify:CR=1 FL=1
MKPYKVLFTADWQLCNNLPYSKPSKDIRSVSDRLLDQIAVVEKIRDLALHHEVEDVFFLGDLFERRLLDAVTLRYGVEAVLRLATVARVWILPGNHDAHSLTSGRFTSEMFGALGNNQVNFLGGSQSVTPSRNAAVNFYPMPWCPLEQVEEHLAILRKQRVEHRCNVLLLHHPILGCVSGTWQCDVGLDANAVCDGWDLVMAGHFHERQAFGPCGRYVGAPMQHDQRDAGGGKRGVEIVTFYGSPPVELRSTFESIDSPRFYTFDWDELVTGEEDDSIIKSGDYVRIGVLATYAEWVMKFAQADVRAKELRENGVHLDVFHKPLQQHEQRLELGKAPTHEKTLSKYLEIAETEGLDKKRLMEIGVAALREVSRG